MTFATATTIELKMALASRNIQIFCLLLYSHAWLHFSVLVTFKMLKTSSIKISYCYLCHNFNKSINYLQKICFSLLLKSVFNDIFLRFATLHNHCCHFFSNTYAAVKHAHYHIFLVKPYIFTHTL